MTRAQRAGLFALAIVVLVGAFIALRPGKDKAAEKAQVVNPTKKATITARHNGSTKENHGGTTASNDEAVPLLEAGKVQTIKVKKGQEIHFKVLSRKEEEVHVHGYDLAKDLPANEPVDMRFKATLEGVYEIELEHSGTPLAKLEVSP